MKLHIKGEAFECFYYPDLLVQCEEDEGDEYYMERPVLIVEVVSPSTERIDKHEKRLVYQRLESLQEYVLVFQTIREVWIYRRSRQWEKEVYNEGAIDLSSVQMSMSLDDIYRNAAL